MAANKKINLVPEDLRVSPKTFQYASFLTKISTVVVILLLLVIVSLGGLFFYFSSQVKTATAAVDSLKQEVVSLESSEQKLVLIKDRLTKVSELKNTLSAGDEIEDFQTLKNLITNPDEARIVDVNIEKGKVETSFFTSSSSALSSFLEGLTNSSGFKSVMLSSLGYNKVTGYALNFIFSSESEAKAK